MPQSMHTLSSLDVPPGRVAVHWFGQSSFALKSPRGKIILVDPYFPHDRPAEKYIHAEPPVDEADLPTDAVLLTHDHSDHTDPETLARIAAAHTDFDVFGPPESVSRAAGAGISANAINAHDSLLVGDFTAYAVHAKPPEGDPGAGIDPPDVTHLGYVVCCGDVRIYFTGDLINNFAENDRLVDDVRKLAPQVGFLTCHPTEGEFPFFDGCARMAQRIGLKVAFPSHYDCFVKRTYDPAEWAAHFRGTGIEARIMGYNETALLP